MQSPRLHNFNPGPAALPLPVLEKIQAEFLDFRGSGMSILEVSHRSREFTLVLEEVKTRFKRLAGLSDRFEVLFLQGGASLQFAMVPLNLSQGRRPAYVLSGYWSNKACQEAESLGFNPLVAGSSAEVQFNRIPTEIQAPEDAAYVHLTSNNTIRGTQWPDYPKVAAPLVADMSSDFLSRPFDPEPFGLIYGGAQKNLGPSGVTVVIIRRDMLERPAGVVPSMLRYSSYAKSNSLYNTPNCFGIYVVDLVLAWLEQEVGGLENMAALNRRKAQLLYQALDARPDFYRPTAEKGSRSLMNVTFRLKDESLEAALVTEALEHGLGGLKGHRSVGGLRASLYNAVPLAAVEALAGFLADFAQRKG